MNNALLDTIKELTDKRMNVDMTEWKVGFNAGLESGIQAIKGLNKQIVSIQIVQALLKETYLEVANNYNIDGQCSDTDKVSCVASKFRQIMLEKLAQANDKVKSTVKVVGEGKNKVFPMRIICQGGHGYGNPVDFCGHELEIEQHDVKLHKWFKYPDNHGKDYGVVCPICKQFVVIDENKLPLYVKDTAEEIFLN